MILNTKPTQSLAGQKCPDCGKGKLFLTQSTDVVTPAKGVVITFTSIWVDRCTVCGTTIYPDSTIRFMEQFYLPTEQ